MELIKLCPACNEKNPVSEVICRVCMTNLSSIPPTPLRSAPLMEEIAESEGDADTTIFSLPEVMTLARSSDGRAIPAPSGCVLGRSGEMAAYFEENLTVSRHHARVLYRDGIWKIEDLGSTNGTWINGNRIETGKQHTLQKGDTVALSMACELRVIS